MLNPQSMLTDTLKLSPQDRIELAGAIWESLAEVPDAVELTTGQRAELIARLEDHHKNPSATIPWNEVRERILKNL